MRGNRTVSDSRSAAMASAGLSGTGASAFKVVHANVPLGQDQNELPGWRQDRCTGTCVMPKISRRDRPRTHLLRLGSVLNSGVLSGGGFVFKLSNGGGVDG